TANTTGAAYTAGGKLQFADAEWSVAGLRMGNIAGGAEYRLDPSTATLKNIFARVFGGTVTGDAVVRDWARTERSSSAHLAAHALSLAAIAAAVPSPGIPLRQMRPAGAVSGSIDATWKFAATLPAADMQFTITPPARLNDGELPLGGTVAVGYSGASGAIAVRKLDLTSRSLHLTASGTASPRNSQLSFAVTAERLHDFDPVLAALHLHSAFMPGLAARATLNGTLTGTLKDPVLNGQLRASDLTIPLPGNRGEARFDTLSADAHYTNAEAALHNGILRRGNQQARFDFSVGLVKGQVEDSSPLSARMFAQGLPLSDLLTLAGYRLPISGTLNGAATLGGTRGAPSGSGTVRIADAVAYGEPIRSAVADLVVSGHEIQASRIVIEHNGAQITGNAAYNVQSTAFRFDLRGSNFNLANLRQLQTARFRTSGQMSFAVQGSGSRERPSINGTLEVTNWVLNGEAAGTLQVKAVTTGDVLRLSGSTGFRTAELTLDGTVRLRQDFPVNLNVRFARLDFDPLLTAFTAAKVTGHSSADGTVTLTGPLKQPDLLVLTGNIPQFSAELESVRLTNDGPIQFTVNHEVFQLAQFRLTGTDTHVNTSGTIALQRGGALDLRSEGGINLALLHTFNANLHSGGQAAFQLQFRGTMARPVLLGRMTITKGDLAYINFPNGLSNINGTLVFNQDRVQVEKLTAETGGGAVSLGGFVSYGQTLGFNLSAKGSGIRLRYPAGVSTTADADLLLTGTPKNLLLSGTLTVMRFSTGPQFDLATVLAKARQTSQVPNPNSPLAAVHFDLHIVSTPELQVQMSAAKLSGNMDVHLRGTADRPLILGRVDITEGEVSFNGTRYTIERGDVTFTNPVRIEPVLDVEVTTRVRDYDIALGFHGPIDRLSTTYRSDPPLPTTDIIALLAFGKTREESAIVSEANPSFTESASNAILGQALTSASSSRVQKLFGVSRIKISPELEGTTADTNNPTAQVTIEQQVSRNITVTYITDLSRSAQQVIQLEYAINRNFSVIALRDQNGVLSLDFRYRQRKR
ncbi:MAG TPA: translocation/assembly module TamB domain-containing protein, partial [Terriglobales bacterium]|nr:translocation/assembly module TamB domain-containing protein [Terriglobales bacterium]